MEQELYSLERKQNHGRSIWHKNYMSLKLTNISYKLENLGATSCSLVVRVLRCSLKVPSSILGARLLCYFLHMFLMLYDIYDMVWYIQVPGKTEWWFWMEFCLFAEFLPMLWYPLPFFLPHVYGFRLFPPFSADFLPKMVPHPCHKLRHGTPSTVFPPTCLLIPPIFCLFSTYVPLIFCLFST